MKGYLFLFCFSFLVASTVSYTPVTLTGTITWTQINADRFKFNYTEDGWATTLVGWIEFPSDPTSHGNAYDVDLYLNQYCTPYFYSRGYMCFGPTLTHVVFCPSSAAGLTPSDCSDSPENLKRSIRTIDILFSTAFTDKFGDLIEYDSLVGFGHSYGSYLMTALTPIETRFTSAVIMSGGKKYYGTQYTDEYYANTSMPLLRLHGVNDSLIPVSQEADETTILRKGGVENFLVVLNNQNHAWMISTVGGVMHNWFRTYDPRNNSAVIPVITSMEQTGNTIYLRGRGFGTNNNGLSMVFDDSSLPYTQVPGSIVSWSDTEVSFLTDSTISSSYIVANADSADYAGCRRVKNFLSIILLLLEGVANVSIFSTSQVVDHFGGVFSRKADRIPGPTSQTPIKPVTPVNNGTPVKKTPSGTTSDASMNSLHQIIVLFSVLVALCL